MHLFFSYFRKKQCNVVLELLKKFQSCRSDLSNVIQRAEQTTSDRASYMGKDNLHRSINKVKTQNISAHLFAEVMFCGYDSHVLYDHTVYFPL